MATRNGAHTLPMVLERYCSLQPPRDRWQLLVVENGSCDNTVEILQAYQSLLPMQLLRCSKTGKNHALNLALDHLSAGGGPFDDDLLIFTDDDALPATDWLLQWERCCASNPGYDIFGGSICPDWAAPPPAWLTRSVPLGLMFGLTEAGRPAGAIHPGMVWGANMVIRARILLPHQRFDTGIGPNGANYAMGSETELNRRLARAGHKSWFYPQASVAHHIRRSQLTLAYLLQKARRAGRGQYLQDQPGQFPQWRNVPRWMYGRFLHHLLAGLAALLLRRQEAAVRHRWELAFFRGYFSQARAGRVPVRRVLLTSYSGELGGMELRMAQEARYLRQGGHDAVLGMPAFPAFEHWQQQLAREQITIAEFSVAPFLEEWQDRHRNFLRARLLQLPRMLAFRSTLVHIAWCWTHYGASATWLAYASGLPAVISVHNAFSATALSSWHIRHLRAAFTNVRGIYAVSPSAMQCFLAIYRDLLPATTRLAVIPNSVDTQRFRPDGARRIAMRRQWGIADDALVIGSVARLSAQKQPQKLLQVFCHLLRKFPRLYLVLAGTGPMERSLRAQVKILNLDSQVIFTGFVHEVETLLPALDLHLLLSRNEGFGIATVEAMACGIPVIASDVPGSHDILAGSKAGVLVAPDTMDDCVAQASRLLENGRERGLMGECGRSLALECYSEQVVGPQVQSFYHGLL